MASHPVCILAGRNGAELFALMNAADHGLGMVPDYQYALLVKFGAVEGGKWTPVGEAMRELVRDRSAGR